MLAKFARNFVHGQRVQMPAELGSFQYRNGTFSYQTLFFFFAKFRKKNPIKNLKIPHKTGEVVEQGKGLNCILEVEKKSKHLREYVGFDPRKHDATTPPMTFSTSQIPNIFENPVHI